MEDRFLGPPDVTYFDPATGKYVRVYHKTEARHMIRTDGTPTIANLREALPYDDPMTYAVLIEYVAGKGQLRRRVHSMRIGAGERVAELERYWKMRGNVCHWKVGKLGQERTTEYVNEAGELLRIDGSGVPACIGYVS